MRIYLYSCELIYSCVSLCVLNINILYALRLDDNGLLTYHASSDTSEFDTRWVLCTFDLVPQLGYTINIIMLKPYLWTEIIIYFLSVQKSGVRIQMKFKSSNTNVKAKVCPLRDLEYTTFLNAFNS